jgi:hypothetical protein
MRPGSMVSVHFCVIILELEQWLCALTDIGFALDVFP